jgi:hypothetical protein
MKIKLRNQFFTSNECKSKIMHTSSTIALKQNSTELTFHNLSELQHSYAAESWGMGD